MVEILLSSLILEFFMRKNFYEFGYQLRIAIKLLLRLSAVQDFGRWIATLQLLIYIQLQFPV